MISNCGKDERGKYKDGQAGDQTGEEWRLIGWYNGSWQCVLRHPDARVRAIIAEMASGAAKNNLIGYDQNQRGTFNVQLVSAGYYPERIAAACEADCSSGVAAIISGAGHRCSVDALRNVNTWLTTYNMRAALTAAGFTLLTASQYLTSDKYLLAGDIILRDSGHVCIQVTDGTQGSATALGTTGGGSTSRAKSAIVAEVQAIIGTPADGIYGSNSKAAWGSARVLRKGSKGTLVKLCQEMLLFRGYSVGSYGIDGDFGHDTDAAVRRFQVASGLLVDGELGINTAYALFG